MTKIMLVEDDKSLREIYGVRLLAEGYDIVSAGDGEEALAMAIKERPQLIVSDVMMPKVSGYDMLDILRSTTETKNIRVIMMTALSSEEQRLRAESLGADRYLVKSQVGIEDVVRVVHEVLEDTPATAAAAQAAPATPAAPQAPAAPAMTTPPVAQVQPPVTPVPPVAPTTPAPAQSAAPAPQPAGPAFEAPSLMKPLGSAPKPASLKSRVIQPLHDPTIAPVNINDLLDKELAKEAGLADEERPAVESADQEKAAINEQLKSFIPPEPTPVEAPSVPQPVAQTTQGPSLLPTPGLGTSPQTAAPSAPAAASPATAPTSIPVVTAPTIPVPVAPPVPPAPTVPLTPTTPTAQPSAPVPAAIEPSVPVAPLPASSEPVIDLTKLPEVPKVS